MAMDRVGIRVGIITTTTLIAVGAMLMMIGVLNYSYHGLLIGRFVYGLGCEV